MRYHIFIKRYDMHIVVHNDSNKAFLMSSPSCADFQVESVGGFTLQNIALGLPLLQTTREPVRHQAVSCHPFLFIS